MIKLESENENYIELEEEKELESEDENEIEPEDGKEIVDDDKNDISEDGGDKKLTPKEQKNLIMKFV